MAEEETPLAVAGGSVTRQIRVRLGPIQAQILLVAGTAEALMVAAHPMIGSLSIKFKEMSRFRYEK